jgi:hypothetical protein
MHFPSVEFLKAVLKGLAYVAENFPDNPRLTWKLILSGCALIGIMFVPTISPELNDLFLVAFPCAIAGCICILLGIFVCLRRWVWRRQDRRAPVVTSLNLK